MPHMQRLTWSGIALHGGRLPGHAASHGCIRLPYAFARELYAFTERGAQVIVADRDTAPVAIAHPGLIRPTTRDEILGRKPAALQSSAAPLRTMQAASLVTLVAARSDRAAMPARAPVAEDRSPAEMLGDIEAALGRLEAYRQRSDAPLRIVVTRWTDRERVVAIQ